MPFKMPSQARMKKAIVADNELSGSSQWINHDLAPSPPERRTWTWKSMTYYWWSTAFNTNQWGNGAALIAVGLTWRQALGAAIIANVFSSLVALGMARPGAAYHIGYPVLSRAVFGMYGSYFFVALRAVICIIWYGVQSFYGGKLLSVALRCIFGSSWYDGIPNTLPASSGTNSRGLLAFFLFWFIQFPFQFVHPSRIRMLFTVQAYIVPVACFGLFGWCIHYGGGLGVESLGVGTHVHGAALAWSMLYGINSVMGTLSPLLVNQPDFTRYCKTTFDASWPQGISIFVSKTVIFFLGCGATAAVQGKFGEAYWNQWDLLSAILDRFWGPAARAGCFFASISFALGVLGTNIGANSMPFGSDFTGLFPKYFTIIRGQILCALLGICVVPWQLLKDATGFITFLGSYSIFMAPVAAIIISDYFLIHRGNIHTPSLFDPRAGSLYFYTAGWNLRASGAWVAGMLFGLPGLIGAYRPDLVAIAAIEMYETGWLLTFVVSFVLYTAIGLAFPVRLVPKGYETGNEGVEGEASGLDIPTHKGHIVKGFERLAKNDGYLRGESYADLGKHAGHHGQSVEVFEGEASSDAGTEKIHSEKDAKSEA